MGNTTLRERQALLGRAWSVPVVKNILEPLTKYYSVKTKGAIEAKIVEHRSESRQEINTNEQSRNDIGGQEIITILTDNATVNLHQREPVEELPAKTANKMDKTQKLDIKDFNENVTDFLAQIPVLSLDKKNQSARTPKTRKRRYCKLPSKCNETQGSSSSNQSKTNFEFELINLPESCEEKVLPMENETDDSYPSFIPIPKKKA